MFSHMLLSGFPKRTHPSLQPLTNSSSKGGDDEAEGVSDMPLVQINIVRSIVAESTAMEVGALCA